MNINTFITMRYGNMDIWLFGKTNPILSAVGGFKANFNSLTKDEVKNAATAQKNSTVI